MSPNLLLKCLSYGLCVLTWDNYKNLIGVESRVTVALKMANSQLSRTLSFTLESI
jgi:hypothetical protein